MAIRGRSFPIRSHLASPVLTQGAPVARQARIFGIGRLDRNRRRFVAPTLIVAPPVVAPPARPINSITVWSAPRRPKRTRFVLTTILASPIVAPRGPPASATFVSINGVQHGRHRRAGPRTLILAPAILAPPPLAPGVLAGQSVERASLRRLPQRPLLAPPVVAPAAPPFIAPAATIVSSHSLRRSRRFVPQTILPAAPAFVAPVRATPNVVGLGAVERPRRLRLPPQVILPPASTFLAPIRQPSGVVGLGAIERFRRRRTAPLTTITAPPVIGRFLAPAATIVSERSVARGPRRAQVILPRLGAPAPLIVRATTLRAPSTPASLRRGRVLLARPVVARSSTFVAPAATVVSDVAHGLAPARRATPSAHLAKPVTATPGPLVSIPLVVGAVARQRSTLTRGVPRPTLPRLGSPRPAPAGTLVSQAVARATTRRGPQPQPRVASEIVAAAAFLAPTARVVGAVARQRATQGRTVPRPTLPRLGSSRPVAAGTFLGQSVQRALTRRAAPPTPHLASRIVAPFVASPPLPPGRFVYQAVARVSERRYRDVVSAPRVAPRVGQPPGAGATLRYQAVLGRALIGRGGRVRLPALGAPKPLRPGTVVSQAVARSYKRPAPPAPRTAEPLVAPFVPFPPLRPGIVLSQAVDRALIGRGGRVLLPHLGPRSPLRPALVVSQATRRPYLGRTVPAPHLARGLVTLPVFPPNAPGTFVGQAAERGAWPGGRRGRVRLAKPVLTPGRVPPALVVSQALQRPYVGRRVIGPHLAPHVAARRGPGATVHYQAVARALSGRSVPLRPRLARAITKPPPAPLSARSYVVTLQSLARMQVGRRVIGPHLVGPIVGPLPRPPVQILTGRGLTGPTPRRATTRPGATDGQTAPRDDQGTTIPYAPRGTTSPRPNRSATD